MELIEYGDFKDVDYYNYLGCFLTIKNILEKYHNRRVKFESLNEYNDDNVYIVKDCLQNNYQFGIEVGYERLCKEHDSYEEKLFNWLDKTKKPYYYIYYQDYEYNTYNCIYGIYERYGTGINNFNHHIAKSYALRKFKK